MPKLSTQPNSVHAIREVHLQYSQDNQNRQFGYIVLLGHQVVESKIGPSNAVAPGSGSESGSTLH